MFLLGLLLCFLVAVYLYYTHQKEALIERFFRKAKLGPYATPDNHVYIHKHLVNLGRVVEPTTVLPGYFKWKESVLVDVRDQGKCASCWAFAVTDCLADRLSILTGGTVRENLSVQELLSCFNKKLFTCKRGGIPEMAYQYLIANGVSKESDYPYEQLKSRDISECRTDVHLVDYIITRPNKVEYNKNKVYGKPGTARSLCFGLDALPEGSAVYKQRLEQNIVNMKTEIMLNGPIVGTMFVRKDLYAYDGKSVYQSAPDSPVMGGHAIEIFGWSDEGQNTLEPGFNAAYWICRNSWGVKWPRPLPYGLMYIRMGINESGIESRASSIEPLMNSVTLTYYSSGNLDTSSYKSYSEYVSDPKRVNFVGTDGVTYKR